MQDIFVAPNHPDNIEETPIPVPKHTEARPKTRHHAHLLSAFCANPDDVRFENQKEDEHILLFLRRHFITNVPWIFISIVFALLPAAIPTLLPFLNIDLSFIPSGLSTILIVFYYLAIFSYALMSFMTWFFNIFIVTQERVIDIDYSHTVIHNVAETKMSHIQDVNYTQIGFISSIFNYGDVFVQTAGNEVNFESLATPHPREATKIIADLIGVKK